MKFVFVLLLYLMNLQEMIFHREKCLVSYFFFKSSDIQTGMLLG
jgi:hypothetical protein